MKLKCSISSVEIKKFIYLKWNEIPIMASTSNTECTWLSISAWKNKPEANTQNIQVGTTFLFNKNIGTLPLHEKQNHGNKL